MMIRLPQRLTLHETGGSIAQFCRFTSFASASVSARCRQTRGDRPIAGYWNPAPSR